MSTPVPTCLGSLLRRYGLPLAALLVAFPAAAQTRPRYVITNLGNLGGATTQALALNATGAVVGYDQVSSQSARAFVYVNGAMSEIQTSVTGVNEGRGINAAGVIVGKATAFPAVVSRGFITQSGSFIDLGTGTEAVGIADDGTVAGNTFPRAFVRSPAGVTTFFGPATGATVATSMTANGITVGYVEGAFRRAFRYAGGTLTDLGTLPGGQNSYGWGANAAGVVVGASNDSTNRTLHAALFANGTVTNLDPAAGSLGSAAYGINSAGVVVGQTSSLNAFYYTNALGLITLADLVVNLAPAGFTSLIDARAINDSGQIVGGGRLANGRLGAYRLDLSTAPTITTHPQSHTVAPGASVVLSVTATGAALQYQWLFNNSPITGATDATYRIAAAAAANAGTYTVRVSSGSESVTSNPATLTVTAGVASRLSNLSILTQLSGAADSFTMGYVVGGDGTSGSKPLVIRAAGPSLTQLGVGGALADPQLELFAGPTPTLQNNNWGGAAALLTAMNNVGAFPFTGPNSLDAALAPSTTSRDNSVKVSPVGNISGTVIAEIYDATPAASFTATTPRLLNVSVLKGIGTGLTAGFVVGGNASRTVLIRAVGPTLGAAPFNVPGVVADPQLALFAGQTQIGANDNWGGGAALTAAFTQVGAFALPAASRDAALLVTLAPGNYSVQVSGVAATTGVAIVEVYEVP